MIPLRNNSFTQFLIPNEFKIYGKGTKNSTSCTLRCRFLPNIPNSLANLSFTRVIFMSTTLCEDSVSLSDG
ncbi:hypothetical protein BGX38DRAFT_1198429 [Terfezia claveryi]|nr:hypothetical protein BGX38DRAFT_1236807 [Terfezia claveryi]KAF8444193.1 hypothetical protein BGX38DRAFT_1198429 [Terfezia claveryi]